MNRTRIALFAVIACCLGVGAAVAVAAGEHSSTDGSKTDTQATTIAMQTGSSPGPGGAPVAAVPPDQAEAFAIFSAPPAASVPDQVALNPVLLSYGGNAALARGVDEQATEPPASTVYVIPARGQVCLVAPEAGTCAPVSRARAGQLINVAVCGPNVPANVFRVTGLLPDGVNKVRAITSDSEIVVEVRNNVYAFDSATAPRTIAWNGGHVDVGLPADTKPGCGR